MDIFPAISAFLFIAFFAYLALKADASPARVAALAVGGKVVEGSRIVHVRAHLNARCGLLNHAGLSPRDGLLFVGSKAVHTYGMLFPIDVVFLDSGLKVLQVVEGAPPGRAKVKGPRGTAALLELASGAARVEFGLEPGQVVGLAL